MVDSREKGKKGERELANRLRELGIEDARRGQQFSGREEQDIVGLDGIYVECKRVNKLNINEAILKAIEDAGDKTPAVFHRRDRGEWLVTMRLDDWVEMYRER